MFKLTDFLFATPSFIAGMGRAIDLGGTMTTFNLSDTPAEADERALLSDWIAVGNDMREAFKKV
jgi:hypothetical protein